MSDVAKILTIAAFNRKSSFAIVTIKFFNMIGFTLH